MAKKMKPTVKAQWLAALRSGQYEQAQGMLREVTEDSGETLGFCCLGVLCNLHAQAHPKIAAKQRAPGAYMGESEVLPDVVRRWAGLPHPKGAEVSLGGVGAMLTDHNDEGASFVEIADAIESQL